MKKIKILLERLGFEEYMFPYLIIFGFLYIGGAVKFLGMLSTLKGVYIFSLYIFGGAIGIFLFLRLFQAICRLIGMNKIYDSIKKKINKNK